MRWYNNNNKKKYYIYIWRLHVWSWPLKAALKLCFDEASFRTAASSCCTASTETFIPSVTALLCCIY